MISGNGDVIEPEYDVAAIGSGGQFALAAARALLENTELDARAIVERSLDIAADICIYTNRNLVIEELPSRAAVLMSSLTPREIVPELDKHIVGQEAAKRAVAIALRNRWRRMQVAEPLRQEITPKNILMIGPTGVGKTEIARRLAKLANAPFVKVEATKFTEVGYVGRDVDSIVKDLADVAVKMTREQEIEKVRERAADAAEERVLDALLPQAAHDGLLHRRALAAARRGDAPEIPQDAAREASSTTARSRSRCARCRWAWRSWRRPAWRRCSSSCSRCSQNLGGNRTKHAQGEGAARR